MSLISWHSSRLRRVARFSSAAETQAAADGDDEAVYISLCLKEVLFGQLDLRPIPELSLKLQLENHQCVRVLKAVNGLVNAPRRWYHRVATDLRKMSGE